MLLEIEPKSTVRIKWSKPVYSVNGQTFFYLADQANYVHLGLYNGAQTDDPHGLIEGTGKRLRHIKISALDPEIIEKLRATVGASLEKGSEYA